MFLLHSNLRENFWVQPRDADTAWWRGAAPIKKADGVLSSCLLWNFAVFQILDWHKSFILS